LLSSTDWATFNAKQNAITLTTTGTSGAATLVGSTLNIPQYADQFVGTVTSVAALTIGTTGTDLSSTVANGTTTPVITLQVPTASATNRGALSSADWTTFNNKQSTITNPVTGTGTTNYLPKWTSGTAIGNSLVFDNGTNVGIGTTSPGAPLDVNGSIYSRSGGLYSDTLTAYSGTSISLNAGTSHFAITVNGSERTRVTSGGNLLIGTTDNSGYKLDVNGTGRFTGALSGTSATFSGLLSANNQLTVGNGSTASNSTINFFGVFSVSYGWSITNDANGLSFTSGYPSTALKLAATGAATFSSTLGINGVADSVKSGTYTPTLAAVYNVASSGSYVCQYMRVGSVVTVSGAVEFAATAANTWTRISISLPISSTFDASFRAGGGGAASATNNVCGIQAAAFSGTVVHLDSNPNTTGNLYYTFSFTYLIM
jgi:hypothetical protein